MNEKVEIDLLSGSQRVDTWTTRYQMRSNVWSVNTSDSKSFLLTFFSYPGCFKEIVNFKNNITLVLSSHMSYLSTSSLLKRKSNVINLGDFSVCVISGCCCWRGGGGGVV